MVKLRFYLKLLIWLFTLSALVVIVLGMYLSRGKILAERHQPFASSASFDFQQGSFENYIAYAQDYLRNARLDSPSEEFIRNASPFVLEPGSECEQGKTGQYTHGVVLTHGLIASPYSMRPIAEYFQSRCFYVLAILLPEHSSRPGEFINTRWQSWAEVQHFATRILQEKVENVFLSGHSVGGELAIYEAATNPEVKALVLFTPAMQITGAAKYAKYFSLLGKLFPKAAWFEVRDDLSLYRYESITFSGARESYGLIQATNKALAEKPLSIPVFTVASVEDNTVYTDVTLAFMAEQQHPASRTLLYSQHPIPGSDKVKVISSLARDQGVLSVSHLGIMLSDAHPEYGRDGAYRSCGHYFEEPENFSKCTDGKRDFYGEVTPENLQEGIVERIAFNPFYEDLLKELDEFINLLK